MLKSEVKGVQQVIQNDSGLLWSLHAEPGRVVTKDPVPLRLGNRVFRCHGCERDSTLTVIFTGCASIRLVPPFLDELFGRSIGLSA